MVKIVLSKYTNLSLYLYNLAWKNKNPWDPDLGEKGMDPDPTMVKN